MTAFSTRLCIFQSHKRPKIDNQQINFIFPLGFDTWRTVIDSSGIVDNILAKDKPMPRKKLFMEPSRTPAAKRWYSFTLHCKDTIPKIRNKKKYSQKRNWAASVSIPTFMFYERFIHKFPRSVCLFCCRKIGGPILGMCRSLTDTWMWKLGLRPRRAIPFLGIHKWDFGCSVGSCTHIIHGEKAEGNGGEDWCDPSGGRQRHGSREHVLADNITVVTRIKHRIKHL